MKKHWMIFRSEATGQHFIYNGEKVINFSPDAYKMIWPDTEQRKLDEVYTNARKKLFTNDKVRYIVVSRGVFVES